MIFHICVKLVKYTDELRDHPTLQLGVYLENPHIR